VGAKWVGCYGVMGVGGTESFGGVCGNGAAGYMEIAVWVEMSVWEGCSDWVGVVEPLILEVRLSGLLPGAGPGSFLGS